MFEATGQWPVCETRWILTVVFNPSSVGFILILCFILHLSFPAQSLFQILPPKSGVHFTYLPRKPHLFSSLHPSFGYLTDGECKRLSLFVFGTTGPIGPFTRFLDHTQRRTSVGRTPLGEWLARLREPLPDDTQHSQQADINAPGGIRMHNRSRRAAAGHLRPRGHWDRQIVKFVIVKFFRSS